MTFISNSRIFELCAIKKKRQNLLKEDKIKILGTLPLAHLSCHVSKIQFKKNCVSVNIK